MLFVRLARSKGGLENANETQRNRSMRNSLGAPPVAEAGNSHPAADAASAVAEPLLTEMLDAVTK